MENITLKYSQHYKEDAQGSIFIGNKSGACNINLVGAAAMSQAELNTFGELFAKAARMQTILANIYKECSNEERQTGTIAASHAQDTLCHYWKEIENIVTGKNEYTFSTLAHLDVKCVQSEVGGNIEVSYEGERIGVVVGLNLPDESDDEEVTNFIVEIEAWLDAELQS